MLPPPSHWSQHPVTYYIVTHSGVSLAWLLCSVASVSLSMGDCQCSKRKMAWAIHTKVGRDIVHGRRSSCIDPEVKNLRLDVVYLYEDLLRKYEMKKILLSCYSSCYIKRPSKVRQACLRSKTWIKCWLSSQRWPLSTKDPAVVLHMDGTCQHAKFGRCMSRHFGGNIIQRHKSTLSYCIDRQEFKMSRVQNWWEASIYVSIRQHIFLVTVLMLCDRHCGGGRGPSWTVPCSLSTSTDRHCSSQTLHSL